MQSLQYDMEESFKKDIYKIKNYNQRVRIRLFKWFLILIKVHSRANLSQYIQSLNCFIRKKKKHISKTQKSASVLNKCSELVFLIIDITPAFWYSATLFSKKFVFPSNEMFSMKSNGF